MAAVLPSWVQILSALLTPVVAIAGVGFAWRQFIVNRRKLQLDLFHERYPLYQAAMKFVGGIVSSSKVSQNALLDFLKAVEGSKWLFGPEIEQYFSKEIQKQAALLHHLTTQLEGLPRESAERSSNLDRQQQIMAWFNLQNDGAIDAKFEKYLRLE